jgi:hypothetical protein
MDTSFGVLTMRQGSCGMIVMLMYAMVQLLMDIMDMLQALSIPTLLDALALETILLFHKHALLILGLALVDQAVAAAVLAVVALLKAVLVLVKVVLVLAKAVAQVLALVLAVEAEAVVEGRAAMQVWL